MAIILMHRVFGYIQHLCLMDVILARATTKSEISALASEIIFQKKLKQETRLQKN